MPRVNEQIARTRCLLTNHATVAGSEHRMLHNPLRRELVWRDANVKIGRHERLCRLAPDGTC